MKMTLTAKITALTITMVVTMGLIITAISYHFLSDGFNQKAQDDINKSVDMVQHQLDQIANVCLKASVSAANVARIVSAVQTGDTSQLPALTRNIAVTHGVDTVVVMDAQGVVLGCNTDKVPDENPAAWPVSVRALRGETSTGLAMGGTNSHFCQRAAVPLMAGSQRIGVVVTEISLTRNNFFVDLIKRFMDVECTLFAGDTRLSTTIIKDGNRAIGTKMDNPAVIDAVLKKGERFLNVNRIFGRDYTTAYWPLRDATGKISGMLFIGKDRNLVTDAFANILMPIVVSAVLVCVVGVIFGLFVARSITEPMARLMTYARGVSAGDLDAKVDGSFYGEMAELAGVISGMVRNLKDKMGEAARNGVEAMRHAEKAQTALVDAERARAHAEAAEAYLKGEIRRLSEVLKVMADGDLSVRYKAGYAPVEAAQSAEGFAELESALNSAITNLAGLIIKIQGASRQMSSSSEQFLKASSGLLNVTQDMSDQAGQAATSTEEISGNITAIASAVEEMSESISTVSSTAEQMSAAMDSVASSVDGIRHSIESIALSATEGSNIAASAAEMAVGATDTMRLLGRAAHEIGKVTKVIKRIAEQTNLLALNATIEAASAGEAGKGFAVVAGEVKDLAHKSALAAEDIADKISGVQANTDKAVKVIDDMAKVISNLNDSVATITDAVETQNEAVAEISENISETTKGVNEIALSISHIAQGSAEVSKNISGVANGAGSVALSILSVSKLAEDGNDHAKTVNEQAGRLNHLSGELRHFVSRFDVGDK